MTISLPTEDKCVTKLPMQDITFLPGTYQRRTNIQGEAIMKSPVFVRVAVRIPLNLAYVKSPLETASE